MTKVVTRFAPSPTGDLHLGGARTALFNYLYAKHTGGEMVLRIEDTDKERSTDESVKAIFDGMDWLGIKYDGDVIFQSSRADRHREVVDLMVKLGVAYKCRLTPEETDNMKVRGEAFRSPYRTGTGLALPLSKLQDEVLMKHAMNYDPDDCLEIDTDRDLMEQIHEHNAGKSPEPFTIRFRGPMTGKTVVKDLIKGDVEFDNSVFDDMVLLRSDGTPTYNLAVVVDDYDMGVTHVIRGDDHLNNAGRQTLLYKALGWEVPIYAHVPLIHGEDGKKLSKRHGASSVMDFRDLGYLPEAMRNYLTRLGWGHGDDEIFTDEQAVEWFDIKDVVSAPARLNFAKMNHINQHYINLADDDRLFDLVIAGTDHILSDEIKARFRRAIPLVKMGAPTIPKLADAMLFALLADAMLFALLADPEISPKAATMLEDPDNAARLMRIIALLEATNWTPDDLNKAIHDLAIAEGVKMGAIGPMVRGILVGNQSSPDLGITLVVLGRDTSLARLKSAV